MPICVIAYSGQGRLAAAVARHLQASQIPVEGIVDRPTANRAALEELGVLVSLVPPNRADWEAYLGGREVGLIVLAGYLRKVPPAVVAAYSGRILNSHPALLPAFGGKGMYGRRVHEAVVRHGAMESGFTVHIVDEEYDQGPILYQVQLPIAGLSAEAVEKLIQAIEREIYPRIVEIYWREKVAPSGIPGTSQ